MAKIKMKEVKCSEGEKKMQLFKFLKFYMWLFTWVLLYPLWAKSQLIEPHLKLENILVSLPFFISNAWI